MPRVRPCLRASGIAQLADASPPRGVRFTVDVYLTRTQLKRPRVSDHALRHTAATLAYRYSHDLRAVQDLLGHSAPRTTARYARVVDMARTNPVLSVPVKL
jgi:integrase